jgi:predicted short-subunit dehydrogenase-like oxidoreductase (DUF2520 family)
MTKFPHISIIGPGKVGTAIAVLAARAGWPLRAVGGRNLARARRAVRAIKQEKPGTVSKRRGTVPSFSPGFSPGPLGGSALLAKSSREASRAAGKGDLVLLTVPDDAIEGLCRRLAAAGAFRPGAIVAHCSGALGSDALAAAKACGCSVGSLHPCQTFPTVAAAVAAMPGAYCFIEGDAPAAAVLARLARAIGGRPVRIAPGAKALYHAAACAASNYLVALMDFALDLGEAGGIGGETLLRALAPLVRATVDNVFRLGPAKALTGPIARGDARTVRGHLAAIARTNPELSAIYTAMARRTLQLARRKGTVSPAAARELQELIREHAK